MTDEKRAAFAAILADYKATQDELMTLGTDHPLNREFSEAVIAAAAPKKRAALRKKYEAEGVRALLTAGAKALGEEAFKAIRDPLAARASAIGDALDARRKALSAKLDELADPSLLRPVPGARRLLREVWASTYSTQTQPEHYAKGEAESAADSVRGFGLEATVERRTATDYPSLVYFDVFINVESDLDVEVARRLKVEVREWVRLCWKRGVNPRVYNPFLPHGYEERVGLDYFGNDLRKAKASR